MSERVVSIVRYQEGMRSVEQAVKLSNAFSKLKKGDRVVIKPNIVTWSDKTIFPKWGVITTSRIVEETVLVLKDLGIEDITIGEGIVSIGSDTKSLAHHAFEGLGYTKLGERYGVKCVNFFERPYKQLEFDRGIKIRFNADMADSDFIIDLPVLKTHLQVGVSLGLKNLKGGLDIPSRKRFHGADLEMDLDYMISQLYRKLPPIATVIDGIYSLEGGPGPDGQARRSNVIIASPDPLSADMVGAKILGYEPGVIKYLARAAQDAGRPADLSDITVVGEKIEAIAHVHKNAIPYNDDGTLPLKFEKIGIKGLTYKRTDSTMCTYCNTLNGGIMAALPGAWGDQPWDNVEILTGKVRHPGPDARKVILVGQCMCELHKDNPAIKEKITIEGCPPKVDRVVSAFKEAGITLDPIIFDNLETGMRFLMMRYKNKKDYEESFYTIS